MKHIIYIKYRKAGKHIYLDPRNTERNYTIVNNHLTIGFLRCVFKFKFFYYFNL